MFQNNRIVWTRVIFTFLVAGMLGLGLMPLAYAANRSDEKPAGLHQGDTKKVQEALRDKGYYTGQVDGVLGPQTRAVTGHLDAQTAGKLGVGPESIGGNFKGAGREVGEGGEEAGHEIKQGKPIAAGKEIGKGLGRGGKKVGKGVKKAVSPESDRGDREKK